MGTTHESRNMKRELRQLRNIRERKEENSGPIGLLLEFGVKYLNCFILLVTRFNIATSFIKKLKYLANFHKLTSFTIKLKLYLKNVKKN